MTVLMGGVAMTVDVGNALMASSSLQGMTNAAALAGANALLQSGATATTATTAATNWATAHPVSGLTITSAVAATNCVTTVSGLPNCTATSPNVVKITQTGTVATTFARLVGFDQFTISATARASKAGGSSTPLNVMIVLDTTQSMSSTTDTSCTVPGTSSPTRLACALYGIQQILTVLQPSLDTVSLVDFPGNKSALATPCSSPTTVPYYTPGIIYNVIPSSKDYKTSSGALNAASPLVQAVGHSPTAGCLKAVGGQGSYYAEAIVKAQAALPAVTVGTQNVIVVLSDGDAQARYTQMYCDLTKGCPSTSETAWKTYGAKQCDEGVTAAKAATAAGTWVYAVAYGAPTTACQTPGTYTPCTAMQNIASDPTKFFSSDANCSLGSTQTNPASQLSSIFLQIGNSLGRARLIPNS
jgi:Flp pilus assembly protein TadG